MVSAATEVPSELTAELKTSDRRLSAVWVWRIVFLVVFLAAWQLAAGRLLDLFWTSSPIAIVETLWNWIVSGLLFRHLAVTFEETIIGFLIGTFLGIAAAFVVGQSELLREALDPFFTAIYGLPKIALAPLFIMWFGIGMLPKIVLAAVSVFFLVFFNTLSGVRQTDQAMVDALRLMGASRTDILKKVVLPSSLPWIFLGLKLGLPYGFVGAVAAEMMASNQGIGFLTQSSAGQFDTSGVFAALLALMIVTTALNEALSKLERWAFRWK